MNIIMIQSIGFIGTILFFVSYQFKENKTLFRVQFFSYLFYTIHLFLLGATTGAISYIINTIRSICLSSSWEFVRTKKACIILCGMQAMALLFTWNGWISVLPVVANIASTIGGYTHNAKKIRFAGMFINSPLWILYDIIVGSWAGILDEIVSETSMILSILRFGWKNLE